MVHRPRVAHAFSAGLYLVVWERHVQGSPGSDIVGQMVTGDGNLWDAPIVIAQGTWQHTMGRPDLAYNRARNEFLVAWNQEDNGSGHTDIRARRVTGTGAPLQPASLMISSSVQSSTNPAVAAIPTPAGKGRHLVAWEILWSTGNRNVFAKLINGDGERFSFYVNGVQMADLVAGSIGSGSIGLGASTYEELGTEVRFDNLKVYGLEE